MKGAISITFGDQAENHVGMQKIGNAADTGFSIDDLEKTKSKFENQGYICELVDLTLNNNLVSEEEAALLIIRNGCEAFVDPDELWNEHIRLDVDKKAKMYGRVVNKNARWNLCYGAISQNPDYENGKGTIVAFDDVPLLQYIKGSLGDYAGPLAENLVAELNLYYDINKCGIGMHGDAERRIVICIKLGETIPLHYQWYYKSNKIGDPIKLSFNHGDMYIMSEKAVGYDWRRKNIPTLRHSAGCDKFTG